MAHGSAGACSGVGASWAPPAYSNLSYSSDATCSRKVQKCQGKMRRFSVERGRSGEGEPRGFPRGQWPRLGPFLRIFLSSVPHGTRCGRREEAAHEFTRGTPSGDSGWTVFWWPILYFSALRGQDPALTPHQIKTPPWPPSPTLSQALFNHCSHDQGHRPCDQRWRPPFFEPQSPL